MSDLVWYAAYGSNLLRARFLTYLKGGRFEDLPRDHRRCDDPSPPRDEVKMTLPFARYFAYDSDTWGGGVAFLDPNRRGTTTGRLYLVTEGQFSHVLAQENGWQDRMPEDKGWYRCVFGLGELDGVPVRTITSLERGPARAPSAAYRDVIARGEVETALLREA
jgi:hypothetical protein